MPTQPVLLSPTAIALNRFGLGARADDPAPRDPAAWVVAQFDRFDVRPAGYAALADAGPVVARYRAEQRARRASRADPAAAQPSSAPAAAQPPSAPAAAQQPSSARAAERLAARQEVQALYQAGVEARFDAALATEAPFVERMVHFWSNHFCVSADSPAVTALAGEFERDAIRPHVLGRFADMLVAVERHPAMLTYLNQAQSVGPDSPAGLRDPARRRGLNENLAREIMELHTLGVRSGYTQVDVTEFARALTGWTVGGPGREGNADGLARSVFRPARHQPGTRTILGTAYPDDGERQAGAVLADLAQAPATASHVATKLARHFAGDDPPPALVARLAATFTATHGDLPSLYRTLARSPEAWVARPVKFKTPWEWTVSALRGTDRNGVGELKLAALQTQLGQRVWKPGAPAGWDDIAASWAGSDALFRRVEVAQRLAAPLGPTLDARALAPAILPGSLSAATVEQIARSESPAGALALMLVSPEFLRR